MSIFTSPWQAWKYRTAYQLRTWQTAWSSRQTKESAVKRFLLLGDSRARAWPLPANAATFPLQIINRGMGFDTSAQTLERLEKHVLPLQPEAVLLQVGINDYKYMALAQRSLESIVTEVTQNIEQIVARLIHSGTFVLLSTIFPICFERWQEERHNPQQFAEGIAAANEYLKQMGSLDRVCLFDAAELLTMGTALPTQWAVDSLHLNEIGYQHLNSQLQSIMAKIKWESNSGSLQEKI
jgi:lysophospholipase L1-like esterase